MTTAGAAQSKLARRLMSLIDLTSLNDSDDDASVQALSELASTAPVKPAAVCIWPRFIPVALHALRGSGIPVCAVTNFPSGGGGVDLAVEETTAALAAGAIEIDVVFPYRDLLAGNSQAGLTLVSRCREACGDRAILKVILETGQLGTAQHIRQAADIAIDGGAYFLKTSTGKTQPGATTAAAAVLFDAIAAAELRGLSIGFKASGGVRTLEEAAGYVTQFEQIFGLGSALPDRFRIGASFLFRQLLTAVDTV